MVSGVIVAVLKEQYADHVVLSDGTRIPLAEGLVVRRMESGSQVTIVYRRNDDGGGVVGLNISRT